MLFSEMNKKSRIIFLAASFIFVIVVSLIFAFVLKTAVPRPLDTGQISKKQQEMKKMRKLESRIESKEEKKDENGPLPSPKLKSLKVEDSYRQGDIDEDEDAIEGMDIYEVGKDIKPGLYKLISTVKDSSYFRLSKKKSDENIYTVSESVFLNFTYVDIKQGQFLYLVDARAVPKDECEPYRAKDNIYENGQYLVGFDVKQGMYKVIPEMEAGYVSVSESAFDTDPLLNKYFDSPITIKIKNGQFLTLSMSKLKLEK